MITQQSSYNYIDVCSILSKYIIVARICDPHSTTIYIYMYRVFDTPQLRRARPHPFIRPGRCGLARGTRKHLEAFPVHVVYVGMQVYYSTVLVGSGPIQDPNSFVILFVIVLFSLLFKVVLLEVFVLLVDQTNMKVD